LEGEWERFFGHAPKFFGRIPFMSAVGNPALYLANFATSKNGADASGGSYSLDIGEVHRVSLEAQALRVGGAVADRFTVLPRPAR